MGDGDIDRREGVSVQRDDRHRCKRRCPDSDADAVCGAGKSIWFVTHGESCLRNDFNYVGLERCNRGYNLCLEGRCISRFLEWYMR